MRIGYASVSKEEGSQSLDLQRDALWAEGVDAGNVYPWSGSTSPTILGSLSAALGASAKLGVRAPHRLKPMTSWNPATTTAGACQPRRQLVSG